MFKNYLLITYRNLRKNKSHVIINALGSGIAIACCLAAYVFVAYNVEFDSFHEDDKVSNTYALNVHKQKNQRDGTTIENMVPYVMAPEAAREIPGIKSYTRYILKNASVSFNNTAFNERVYFSDSVFFDMFDFPLTRGSYDYFQDLSSIYISSDMAIKYFGDEDPIGKILKTSFQNDTDFDVIVRGVYDKIDINSSLVFDFMMRIENYDKIDRVKNPDKIWGDWREMTTFFELESGVSPKHIGQSMASYVDLRNEYRKHEVIESFQLNPFKAYITQDDMYRSYTNLRISHVPMIVFSVMALMILLIACFNLTNTTVAIMSKRLKEVGVRKVLGARKLQIMYQFLMETVVIMLLSIAMGLFMASYIVPAFTEMWELPFSMADFDSINLLITLFGLLFLGSVLAGIYPALFSLKFEPVKLMKGTVRTNGSNFFTRALTCTQFAISVMVLIAGVVFIQNNEFQEKLDFGYDRHALIAVNVPGNAIMAPYVDKIKSNPKILSIGMSRDQIGWGSMTKEVEFDGIEFETKFLRVSQNYLPTIGLERVLGKNFPSEDIYQDSKNVIVNEAFVNASGLENPIGASFFVHNKDRKIIGVVQNHLDNLYSSSKAEPFVYAPPGADEFLIVTVNTDPSHSLEIKKYLEESWISLYPDRPFSGDLQSEFLLGEVRAMNANMRDIFLFLTFLGALLSGSGIYALASLNVDRRSKEIGIRKSLGATVHQIVSLLNKEFVWVMTIAAILGGIGGYYLIDMLLNEIYSVHMSINMISVVLSGIFVMIIGLSTTSFTIIKAASMNPILKLRDE